MAWRAVRSMGITPVDLSGLCRKGALALAQGAAGVCCKSLAGSKIWRSSRSSKAPFACIGATISMSSVSIGTSHGIYIPFAADIQHLGHHPMCSTIGRACFSSEANTVDGNPTDIVQDLYLKMLKSVKPVPVPPKKKRRGTMPPNAWLWSLIENCASQEHIQLLFQILQELRIFRLAYLRINENFNFHLCSKIAEACARAGALDFGKKTLCKHNVYGITPNIASAHHLLLYAKEHNDVRFMLKIVEIMKKNSLQLQPTTADIIFSICYNTDNWNLISKLSEDFIKNGMKLHPTAFGIWMEFAAKRGDVPSLWRVEELRSISGKLHTVTSAFSCAKGYLLEHKPDAAASVIHMLNQNLADSRKPVIKDELQKLVSKWPSEVLKRQRKDRRESFDSTLRSNISAMVGSLSSMGLEAEVNLDGAVPC